MMPFRSHADHAASRFWRGLRTNLLRAVPIVLVFLTGVMLGHLYRPGEANWQAAWALATSLEVNWQAVAAVATFAAVAVALLPTWRDLQRRRRQARVLRFQLLGNLVALRPLFGQRTIVTPLTPRQAEPITSLEILMAQGYLLRQREYKLVARALLNLALTRHADQPVDVRGVLTLIDQAIAELQGHGFFPRRQDALSALAKESPAP